MAPFSYLASRSSRLLMTVSFCCLMESNKLCSCCLCNPTASSCCTKLTHRWTCKNTDTETVIRYCWGGISKYIKYFWSNSSKYHKVLQLSKYGNNNPKCKKMPMHWSEWVDMDFTCGPYEWSADSPYRWALHKQDRRTSSSPECVRDSVFSVSNLNKTNNRTDLIMHRSTEVYSVRENFIFSMYINATAYAWWILLILHKLQRFPWFLTYIHIYV